MTPQNQFSIIFEYSEQVTEDTWRVRKRAFQFHGNTTLHEIKMAIVKDIVIGTDKMLINAIISENKQD